MAKPAAAHRGLQHGQVYDRVLTRQRLTTRTRTALVPAAAGAGAACAHPSRTNLTTRALAALFGTSQSTVDRVIHHLVPVLAHSLTGDPDQHHGPSIIDGTLTPVHDQSISAISKNHRRSVNIQIIICAHRRPVMVAGRCWPANRNDVVVARATVTHLFTGHEILGDGGYRGITTIAPAARSCGRIIRDDHYRAHRRIRARVEHVTARLKDWQIPRQCRQRGQAINHSLQIMAGLWNLKTHKQLRVD